MKFLILVKRILSVMLCLLFPTALLAHPGHGHEGTVLHDLIHAAWIAAILVVIALPLLGKKKFRWWKSTADRDDG